MATTCLALVRTFACPPPPPNLPGHPRLFRRPEPRFNWPPDAVVSRSRPAGRVKKRSLRRWAPCMSGDEDGWGSEGRGSEGWWTESDGGVGCGVDGASHWTSRSERESVSEVSRTSGLAVGWRRKRAHTGLWSEVDTPQTGHVLRCCSAGRLTRPAGPIGPIPPDSAVALRAALDANALDTPSLDIPSLDTPSLPLSQGAELRPSLIWPLPWAPLWARVVAAA